MSLNKKDIYNKIVCHVAIIITIKKLLTTGIKKISSVQNTVSCKRFQYHIMQKELINKILQRITY